MKDLNIQLDFISKMTQFNDVIPSLLHLRKGNKAKSQSTKMQDGSNLVFSSFEVDKDGNEYQVSYDVIKGLGNEKLSLFFDKLYKNVQADFPEISPLNFYIEQKEHFERLLPQEILKEYSSLIREIVLFLSDKIEGKNFKKGIGYTKHPQVLDLMKIPVSMLKVYSVVCEYSYINLADFGEIPFPAFAILGVKYNGIDIQTIPLDEYAKGFIEGYNTTLIPFIDNNETRAEVILNESIFKGNTGFLEHRTGIENIEYKPEAMYERGLFEGKRYKAWEIIFQTPHFFIKYFQSEKSIGIKPKAPVIGLFCGLINKIEIDRKEEIENAKVYCERICNRFNLTYTDRVRQNFNVNETKKLLKELAEIVFPLIDETTKNKIQNYIDNKQASNEKLYV